MNLPVISIITVVYNGKNFLERTIHSVIQQTYPHIEYLIIDGGSTDGTVEMIKKYGGSCRWISEKDGGIYDAMNKGMKMAKGDYLLFLNAGDELHSKDVLEKIFSKDQILRCVGKAGTFIFCDTKGLHKGGHATKNPRILFNAVYLTDGALPDEKKKVNYWVEKSIQSKLTAAGQYALSGKSPSRHNL